MQIEIHKTKCSECDGVWYELDGYELNECPHCDSDSDKASDIETQIAELEIDPLTGTLSFAGSSTA